MIQAVSATHAVPKPPPVAIVTTAFLACGWGKANYEVGESITDPLLAEQAIRAGKATPVVPPAVGAAVVEAARPRGPRAAQPKPSSGAAL